MRLTPLDIHEQTFRMTFRGFDPVEVDAFLQRIADELERIIEERDALQNRLDEEQRARKVLDDTLAQAHSMQANMVGHAREEAELVLHQAQLKADRILAEANEELLRLRRELREIRERRTLWLLDLESLASALKAWAAAKETEELVPPELIVDSEPAKPDPPGEEVEFPEDAPEEAAGDTPEDDL